MLRLYTYLHNNKYSHLFDHRVYRVIIDIGVLKHLNIN